MRCAVLGDPVDHSLSPVIHRAAYRELGLGDWRYDAVPVSAGHLAAFVDGLDPTRWRGLSLTMPLKREAPPLLSSYDEWVAATGACNTVLLERDGNGDAERQLLPLVRVGALDEPAADESDRCRGGHERSEPPLGISVEDVARDDDEKEAETVRRHREVRHDDDRQR